MALRRNRRESGRLLPGPCCLPHPSPPHACFVIGVSSPVGRQSGARVENPRLGAKTPCTLRGQGFRGRSPCLPCIFRALSFRPKDGWRPSLPDGGFNPRFSIPMALDFQRAFFSSGLLQPTLYVCVSHVAPVAWAGRPRYSRIHGSSGAMTFPFTSSAIMWPTAASLPSSKRPRRNVGQGVPGGKL